MPFVDFRIESRIKRTRVDKYCLALLAPPLGLRLALKTFLVSLPIHLSVTLRARALLRRSGSLSAKLSNRWLLRSNGRLQIGNWPGFSRIGFPIHSTRR